MDLQSTAPSNLSQSSSGRNGPRSRNGCWTCRTKKVKCDESRPQCRRCLRLKLLCDYKPRRKDIRLKWEVCLERGRTPGECESLTGELLNESLQKEAQGRSLSAIRMPVLSTSASSVILTGIDHEAIRYFRTTFAQLHHTKTADYSMYSIMFKVAETNPIVMHMVLAIGGREMEFHRRLCTTERGASSPLNHYSSALKLMAQVIGDEETTRLSFESTYTALYLMLLYEQKYGDEKCLGFGNHLNGAALMLKQHFSDNRGLLNHVCGLNQRSVLSRISESNQISLYAARLIMWIVQFDISAASSGVGGQLHATIYGLLDAEIISGGTDDYNSINVLDRFEQLHHFSSQLYRTLWGKEYPQSELLDDVENRNIFFLEGACIQLRFVVAQLAQPRESQTNETNMERKTLDAEVAIDNVSNRFIDLIEVAVSLSPATDNSHRLVANLRRVIPLYYAVILSFLRVKSGLRQRKLNSRQNEALRQIMNLAFQAHKYDGEKAMVRIAWPLFIVAVETDDRLQREWVLGRFSAISKFGLNLQRAYRFLAHVVESQSQLGRRVDIQRQLQTGDFEVFVI
ncbi:fungal-specific transcription factor domain-containing protein [Aspergillus keveii]|uniref:Fungal-specific transcription factor domain-containing protein n=1 Tax=Aspergillus keveii TaxID=714993 RepID=A0ABR4G8U4_9EURO